MTSYSLIIPLQRRHLSIDLMASIMIPISNLITETYGVIQYRFMWSQNRKFALLTDKILCLRSHSLPTLTLPTLLVTSSFPETPINGSPWTVTHVSSTHFPICDVLRSCAHSILWSWAIFWLTTSIKYMALLGRQPILDQKRTQPVPLTPRRHFHIY